MKELSESEALQRAAALCSTRECCISEIEEKLARWGQSRETQARIIARLLDERFIDESRFCRAYALDKLRYNHWGRVKISQALRMLGVDDTDREQAVRALPETEYNEILRHLADSKRPSIKGSSAYERNGKLIRFLLGRGFEMDRIRRAVDETDDF